MFGYFKYFLKDKKVASVVPTRVAIVKHICSFVNFNNSKVFVEYGAGLGVMSRYILRYMKSDGRFFVFETNIDMLRVLSRRLADCRIVLSDQSAFYASDVIPRDLCGKLKIVFKNYPLDNSCNPVIPKPFHVFSCRAAAMTICAGKVSGKDGRIKMQRGIYAKNEIDNQVLKDLPLDLKLFESQGEIERDFWDCVSSPETVSEIRKDIDLAKLLQVHATPTVFLNGVLVQFPSFPSGSLEILVNQLSKQH